MNNLDTESLIIHNGRLFYAFPLSENESLKIAKANGETELNALLCQFENGTILKIDRHDRIKRFERCANKVKTILHHGRVK